MSILILLVLIKVIIVCLLSLGEIVLRILKLRFCILIIFLESFFILKFSKQVKDFEDLNILKRAAALKKLTTLKGLNILEDFKAFIVFLTSATSLTSFEFM